MAKTQIQNMDLWAPLRAVWQRHRNLLAGHKMFVVDDFGHKMMVVDYEDNQRVRYVKVMMDDGHHSPTITVKMLEELSGRNVVWFGWAFGALFTLVSEGAAECAGQHVRTLYCWDPEHDNNPFVDPLSGTESDFQPHVWSNVHRLAFGSQHCLLLCQDHLVPAKDADHGDSVAFVRGPPSAPDPRVRSVYDVLDTADKLTVMVFSWSEHNTLGRGVGYKPTPDTLRFRHPILDIGCTYHNGSAVLDSTNHLYVWGEISEALKKRYVTKMGNIHLGDRYKFQQMLVIAQKFLLMDNDGRVCYVDYHSGPDIGPVTALKTPVPIETMYGHNTAAVCLLASADQTLYLYDGNADGKLVPVIGDDISIADAYYLNVIPATIDMEQITEQQAEILDRICGEEKLANFNNPLQCDWGLQLVNGFVVHLQRQWLRELLRYECKIFADQPPPAKESAEAGEDNEDDLPLQVLQTELGHFSPVAVYVMLYFLHIGELCLDGGIAAITVPGELMAIADRLGFGRLKQAIAEWDANQLVKQTVSIDSGN